MREKIHKNRRTLFILVGILFLAVFFRFFHLFSWLSWGMDQEYEAYLVKNIITGRHFPLIGVNASDTGLYLGPAFIYFASIPFMFFNGNPLGWAFLASVVGVLVTYLIYRVGKEMFSAVTAVFASLFYGGSFLTAFYDRQFWNPMLVPLFSLFLGFFLYKILKNHPKVLVLTALFFGLAIQSHLSVLIFIPLIVYVFWVKHRIFSKRIIFLSLGIFLLTQIPLLIFEVKHNFINAKAAVRLIANRKTDSAVRSSLAERNAVFISALGRFFWLPTPADLLVQSGQCKELLSFKKNASTEGLILVLAGIAIFLWWYHKLGKKTARNAGIVSIGILLSAVIFTEFYSRQTFEYYLLFLFPWLALILGESAHLLWQNKHLKLVVFPVIVIFILLNFITLFSASYSYSYEDKISAINFVKDKLSGKSYSLEALGECPRYGGYSYLFNYFVGTPTHSYMDSYFDWLYPDKGSPEKQPARIILLSLIDHRNTHETIAKWEKIKLQYLMDYRLVDRGRFGKIQILILSPK